MTTGNSSEGGLGGPLHPPVITLAPPEKRRSSFSEERLLKWLDLTLKTVGLITLFFAFWTLRADHDRSRRQTTLNLISEWRQTLDAPHVRDYVELLRQGSFTDKMLEAIAVGDTKMFKGFDVAWPVGHVAGDNKVNLAGHAQNMRAAMISTLNLYEQVCVAYRNNIGDHDMIGASFMTAIHRDYQRLRPFVEARRGIVGGGGWQPIEDALTEWAQQPQPGKQQLP